MMKRRFLLPLILFLLFLLTGCTDKDSADKYLGEQITSIKEKDPETLSFLLEKGIEESNDKYTLQFPKELKDTYLTFLQEAFQTVTFEVEDAKKNGKNVYTVQVHYTPVDISATTKDICNTFLSAMNSSNLNTEMKALLEQAAAALKDAPRYNEKTYSVLSVDKTEEGFQIKKEDMEKFLSRTIANYMTPYDSICELLNARDFLNAYLDASFKGDVARFALHCKKTESEILSWYDSDVFLPSADMPPSYSERYMSALKELLKQCVYSVGIPKKESGVYDYTIDVTVTPNNSLTALFSEWSDGDYYSEEEVNQTLVELLEKYAANPSYGDEKIITVRLNLTTIMEAGNEGAEITNLAREILPLP